MKPEWADLPDDPVVRHEGDTDFVHNVVRPINAQAGDDLPVSAFLGREDGTWDSGTAASEKRGVAAFVPVWEADNCVQCNQCAYVCPHATIRPFVLTKEEEEKTGVKVLKAVGKQFPDMGFRIQVNVMDCLGCSNCVDVCPGNKNGKALTMQPIEEQYEEQKNWEKLAVRDAAL